MSDKRERQREAPRRRPGKAQQPNPGAAPSEQDQIRDQTGKTSDSSSSPSAVTGRPNWLIPAVIATAVAAAGALSVVSLTGGGADQITDAETQSRISAHQSLMASGGLPVKLVGADELDDAFASMPESVDQEVREEMREQVNQGRLQLAWVTLWDTHAEDGDILRFESSSSIPVDVMALNAKTKIAIPYPPDGQVLVTGVKDGGGGITIALESGATSIAWPTMQPGDQLVLPITPSF